MKIEVALVLAAPYLLLLVSVLFTIVHTLEEVLGKGGPLWVYLARIAKLYIPPRLGEIAVCILTPAMTVAATSIVYTNQHPWWVGLLLGLRLGDCACTHWLPWLLYPNSNPGIVSTILYLSEATLLVVFFHVNMIGACVGVAVFGLTTLPLILAGLRA